MTYPGATPEFRFLQAADGTRVLQVRYISLVAGYNSGWKNVPVVEDVVEGASATIDTHPKGQP